RGACKPRHNAHSGANYQTMQAAADYKAGRWHNPAGEAGKRGEIGLKEDGDYGGSDGVLYRYRQACEKAGQWAKSAAREPVPCPGGRNDRRELGNRQREGVVHERCDKRREQHAAPPPTRQAPIPGSKLTCDDTRHPECAQKEPSSLTPAKCWNIAVTTDYRRHRQRSPCFRIIEWYIKYTIGCVRRRAPPARIPVWSGVGAASFGREGSCFFPSLTWRGVPSRHNRFSSDCRRRAVALLKWRCPTTTAGCGAR